MYFGNGSEEQGKRPGERIGLVGEESCKKSADKSKSDEGRKKSTNSIEDVSILQRENRLNELLELLSSIHSENMASFVTCNQNQDVKRNLSEDEDRKIAKMRKRNSTGNEESALSQLKKRMSRLSTPHEENDGDTKRKEKREKKKEKESELERKSHRDAPEKKRKEISFYGLKLEEIREVNLIENLEKGLETERRHIKDQKLFFPEHCANVASFTTEEIEQSERTFLKKFSHEFRQYVVEPGSGYTSSTSQSRHAQEVGSSFHEEEKEACASETEESRKLQKGRMVVDEVHLSFLRATPRALYAYMQQLQNQYSSIHITKLCATCNADVNCTHWRVIGAIDGPENDESDDILTVNNTISACGRSISTYPYISNKREGDPVCDCYRMRVMECRRPSESPTVRTVFALSDGCNWGNRSRRAARKCSLEFVEYMCRIMNCVVDPLSAMNYCIRALSHAHKSIVEENIQQPWVCGTSTICGGIILPIQNRSGKNLLVMTSVGDCKAFICQRRNGIDSVIEITAGQRADSLDASDPGGRIGPYQRKERLKSGVHIPNYNPLPEFAPDLRNLDIFVEELEEGDVVLVVSDGIYDNMDPTTQGLLPADFFADPSNVPSNWKELDADELDLIMSSYRNLLVSLLLKDCNKPGDAPLNPRVIVNSLIAFAERNTVTSREWMMAHPEQRLPSDYRKFPGKMDHTTVLCFSPSSYQCGNPHQVQRDLSCSVSRQTAIPLSVLVEHNSAIVKIQALLPVGAINVKTILSDDIYLRIMVQFPISQSVPMDYLLANNAQEEKERLYGLDELGSVERAVKLPSKVVSSSKKTVFDRAKGLVTISFEKYPSSNQGSSMALDVLF